MHKLKVRISCFLLKAVALLPFPVLYLLSDIACVVVHRIVGYRKRVVRNNLRNSFPEKSQSELRTIEDDFYRHLCDCFVEDIKLLHVSDAQMNERMEVRGAELVNDLAKDGRPIILFLGHCGNWEWVQKVEWHIVPSLYPAVIYHPVKNKVMDDVMHTLRSRFPAEQIPQLKAVRALLRHRNEGRQFVVAFISDQRPNSAHLRHWATLLGQETAYAVGGEELGRHVDAHFVYIDVEKLRRGHYRATFVEMSPAEGDYEYPYSIRFLQMLETTIRRDPHCWLWSHNKWKYKKKQND